MLLFGWFRKYLTATPRRRARAAQSWICAEVCEPRQLLSAALGWTAGVSLPAPASEVSAVTTGGGSHILLFGNGSAAVQYLNSGTASWGNGGSIDQARNSPGVVYLPGAAELLVFGGSSVPNGTAIDGMVNFNSGVVTRLSSMDSARQQFAYTTDGTHAYAIGGIDDNGVLLNSIEQYAPTDDSWNTLAALPQALAGAQAVYDGVGNIYVFGGTTAAGVSNAVYEYSIQNNAWSTVAPLSVAESFGAAVVGSDGKFAVIGGIGASGNSIATVQSFDPTSGTWSLNTPLPAPVSNEAAVVDSLGRIEVIGGRNVQAAVTTQSAAVYVTDLSPVFTSTAPADPIIVAGTTLFTYSATASGTPVPTFSLVNPPANAHVNPVSGVFTFTPSLNQTGPINFDIRASNGFSQVDQNFMVTVKAPAPTGLSVTGASLTTISLSWNASAGPVSYYRVYMDGQNFRFNVVADNVIGTSATITGLNSQIAGHPFWVTSVDKSGYESLFSTSLVGHTWTAGALGYTTTVGGLSIAATHQLVIQLSNPGANPAPTTYAIVSGAPAGMTINSATGLVSWTPQDSDALHGFFPVFSSTNAVGTVTLQLGIAVQINYPVITVAYPGATGSTAYANLPFQMQFSDGSGAPVTWKLNSGPAGATLSSTGLLTWTPTMAQALASGSAAISVTATNYAGSSTDSLTVPLLTAAPPSNLTFNFNKTAGTVGANWGAPAFDGSPVASYLVTLSYSYTVSGGSGRGGGWSHTYTTTKSVSVSSSTFSTLFSGIPFGSLPYGRTHFAIGVVALDAAGNPSAPAVTRFIV